MWIPSAPWHEDEVVITGIKYSFSGFSKQYHLDKDPFSIITILAQIFISYYIVIVLYDKQGEGSLFILMILPKCMLGRENNMQYITELTCLTLGENNSWIFLPLLGKWSKRKDNHHRHHTHIHIFTWRVLKDWHSIRHIGLCRWI